MIQNYLGSRHVEIISYSQFKSVLKKGLIADLAIGEKTIEGNIKGEAVKEILSAEKLKDVPQDVKDGMKSYPFVAVRVDDPGLTAELEEARVSFRGGGDQYLAADPFVLGGSGRPVFSAVELSAQENGIRKRLDADRQEQG
jgi:hypothetical protein